MSQALETLTPENEATYDSLMSLIENNQNRLALILVACDDFRLRQRVITRYEVEAEQAKIQPYRIVLGTEPSLRAGLAKLKLRQGDAAVVTVTGAEWLLQVKLREEEEQSDLDKFFGYLQWTREGLREFRCPIVLWVTHQILREMSLKAPDFWSWRKAVLRFASQEAEVISRQDNESRSQLPQTQPDEEFLPPLEELLLEIQQLESTSPKSANLATLYGKLGQVYANQIATGKATNLEQERQWAIDAFQNSIHRHQELNHQSALVNVLLRFGNFLFGQSRYEEAIAAYQQSLAIAREIGNHQEEAASLNNLGSAYGSLGQYERAIEFYQQFLAIARAIDDRWGEANSLGNLGLAYDAIGQPERAIDFQQQSLAIARAIGDRWSEANSLGNLGNAYNAIGQYERAIEVQQQSLAIAHEIGDRWSEANSLGNLGNAYDAIGQPERAIDFQQQSLAIAREIGDRRGEANSWFNLGVALAKLNRKQESIEAYQNARRLYQEMELGHMVERCDNAIGTP